MIGFRKPYLVTRRAPGHYVNGYWQEGAAETITILASVQPLNMNEMDALPEGRRSSSAVKIYTDTPLQRAEQSLGENQAQNPDILTWLGRQYEVSAVEPYQSGVVPHYKCIAVEVTE